MIDLNNYIRTVENFPKPGIHFKDITPLLANPAAYKECIKQMKNLISDIEFDRIAGIDARGFLFASALAYVMRKPLIPIRKKGKLPYTSVSVSYDLEYGSAEIEMHSDAVQAGEKILIVDDLLATGGTLLAACELIEQAGAEVASCLVLIDLPTVETPQALQAYKIRSLLQL